MQRKAKGKTFKLKGHALPGPNQRDDTDSPFQQSRMMLGKSLDRHHPKTMKLVDKYVNPVIEKAGEHFANVATAGGYKAAKKYIRKKGGLAKTFDKYFTEPTPEQKKKNTEKIENFVSTLKDKLPTGGFGRKKKNKK
jgi:hypothetical protein